jgi:hypothetical protein
MPATSGAVRRRRRAEPAVIRAVIEAYEVKHAARLDGSDDGMPIRALRADVVLSWTAQDPRGTGVRWVYPRRAKPA